MPEIMSPEKVTARSSWERKSARGLQRRRPTAHQGRALEALGHAIEYLVDSQMHLNPESSAEPATVATDILMRLSREVFAECREIVPLSERVRLWLTRTLSAVQLEFTPSSMDIS